MLASTPAPDLRDWGALSTGSIVIPGAFFWHLTRTSATLSRFSVLGGLCFVSVRTRSKLTFRHISVKYQKNARSLTIHVYMNGADGFGEQRSRPGTGERDGFGGRRLRKRRASRARPARSRYRGGHRRRRSGTPGAPLPHPVRGGQPQPASPSVELPWSAASASIFDPPEAARAAPRSLPDASAHRRPERRRTRCPVTGRVGPD